MKTTFVRNWSLAVIGALGGVGALGAGTILAQAQPVPPSVGQPPAPHRRPAPPAPEEAVPMNASGKIVEFAKNKHGDVDGFKLSDDTVVKFPPHVGQSLTESLKVGTEVEVRGNRHETPLGEVHLHAREIVADGHSYTIEAPKSPKPPRHEAGPGDWMTKAQADEILSELRAIRQLLEARGK